MNRPIPNGLLLAIEGIDGAGKSSIAGLLAQWCGERGLGCMLSKEPTGNKWGKLLRESAKSGRLTVERELELLELDRRHHIETAIQPALDEGSIVILDRYYWSTAAYQGSRGLDYDEIVRQNETFAPVPDLVLLLDIDPDGGLQRIRMRGDKPNHFEAKESLIKARDIFIDLCEKSPNGRHIQSGGHLKDTWDASLGYFIETARAKLEAGGVDPAQAPMFFGE